MYKDQMQNIQIKRTAKRSVESLIDESAIDNQFNYQAYQVRRTLNESIKSLQDKLNAKDKQIDRLNVLLNTHQDSQNKCKIILKEQTNKIKQLHIRNQQINKSYQQVRKRVQYLELINAKAIDNRAQLAPFTESESYEDIQTSRNQAFKEVTNLLSEKVKNFMKEISGISMSNELANKIECFLEELVYMNPQSIKQPFCPSYQSRKIGTITQSRKKQQQTKNLTNNQEWKVLEKSLENLKSLSRNKRWDSDTPPLKDDFRQMKKSSPEKVEVSPYKLKMGTASNGKKRIFNE